MFEQIVERCHCTRDANCELFEPRQYAAPAACAHAFLNGAIGVRLPDAAQWVNAYRDDPEMSFIIGFVSNPGTITNKGLVDANLNANYRSALHQSHIFLEDGIFYFTGNS